MEDELEDEESAMNYMEQVHQTPQATILSKEIKPWSESAPLPLITSTLQQQASALYGSNPKNTMMCAQRLYEAGYITYMRTDKAVLSEEAITEAKKWVAASYGEEYVKETQPEKEKKPKKAKEQEQKTQEAHEAIRPTHMDMVELHDAQWSAYDKKIYHLIWQRAIQSVMSAAKGETCVITSQIKDDEFVWRSQWHRTLFEGWKKAGKIADIEEQEQKQEESNEFPALEPGQAIEWITIKAEPKETKAQGRYTEATLIRELEKHGIGRPSTFASLLAVIQEKNYVEITTIQAKEIEQSLLTLQPTLWPPKETKQKKKVGAEKNKLIPTALGRSVLSFMLKYFDDLFSYDFTNHMEKSLDKIAEGTIFWKDVIKESWHSYKDRYEEMQSNESKNDSKNDTKNTPKIKHFQQYKAVQTKKGPLLLQEHADKPTEFLGWPKEIAFEDITEQQALEFIQKKQSEKEQSIGEWNGTPILKKSGKFGPYFQCDKITIPFQEEPLEKTIERLQLKTDAKTGEKRFKDYVIRTGQYGPYIMKTSLKRPQFVSLPKGINPDTVTEKEVEALYKMGLEGKKKLK
jgi:DNA topoisomerase-1